MTAAEPKQLTQTLADSTGMLASIACAVHCAAMPLVISYLPMLGLSWLADESFHQVMAIVCFLLALAAFVPGWRKHGSLAPAIVGSAGVAVIAVAAFTLEGECCPACAVGGEASSTTAAAAELEVAESVCLDDQCPHCLAAQAEQKAEQKTEIVTLTGSDALETNAQPSSAETATAWWLPFVTPLGGVLLIAGHLVNHRKSCGCPGDSCCPHSEVDEA